MATPLAIIIPTHNRVNTVKVVVDKLLAYFAEKCDLYIYILDSSPEYMSTFNDERINYIHCPDLSLFEKASYCANLIASNFPQIRWILFSPDDDIFIPNENTMNQVHDSSILGLRSKYVYIPSRYIMFNAYKHKKDSIAVQECWSHHSAIPHAGLPIKDQLDIYSYEGVASLWGLYSYEGFKLACEFRLQLARLLPEDFLSIVEDMSNLLVLTYQWLGIADPLICLRGDDRRFRRSKKWKSSWIVFNLLRSKKNKSLLSQVSTLLRDSINKSFSDFRSENIEVNNDDCLRLIERHVTGYKEGRSRLYNLNNPVVIGQSNPAIISFYAYQPHRKFSFLRKNFSAIQIPCEQDKLDTHLYPSGLIFGDKRATEAIYANRHFLFSQRDR